MTDFTSLGADRLRDLRTALLDAAAADLVRADAAPAPTPGATGVTRLPRQMRRRWVGARLACALLLVVVALPGFLLATDLLGSGPAAADALPAGSRTLTASQPTCTAMRAGVEYECTFAVAPKVGRIVRTVDADGRIDGGCLPRDVVERIWICYFGGAAIDRRLVAPELL